VNDVKGFWSTLLRKKERSNEFEDVPTDILESPLPHQRPEVDDQVYGAILGSCIGDALGVPVEFKSRIALKARPVRGMIGYGTWNQPPGTWSDDSSMFLCTAESLTQGYSLQDIADRFVKWYREGYWTAHGEVFDIGSTTKVALDNLQFVSPAQAGMRDEFSNGNGSLMRILPLAFYTYQMGFDERARIVGEVSSITHAHRRSVIACIILVEIASNLLKGYDRFTSYRMMQDAVKANIGGEMEVTHFPLVFTDLRERPEEVVSSGGYVVDTLETAIWCLLKHDTFQDVVLAAVNMGGDADTSGAVAGGLAGLAFGYSQIPKEWLLQLVRKDDIHDLAKRVLSSMDATLYSR
jgi:ADP-ribosylglycohydrolase